MGKPGLVTFACVCSRIRVLVCEFVWVYLDVFVGIWVGVSTCVRFCLHMFLCAFLRQGRGSDNGCACVLFAYANVHVDAYAVCCVHGWVCMCICLCCSVLFRLKEVAVSLHGQQWPVLAKDTLLEGNMKPPEPHQFLV